VKIKKDLILILILLSITTLHAKAFIYSQVHSMPQSIEKDYYIWRFLLQKSTSAEEAKSIIQEASNLNKKLRDAYKNKTGLSARLKPKPAVGACNSTKGKDKAEANKHFKSAIKFVQKNMLQKAADHFYTAHNKYKDRWEKDKTLFWLYLLTEDKHYLEKLNKSHHVNMYRLLAADLANEKYPKNIITPSISRSQINNLDAQDPITWARIKAKMNMADVNLDKLAEDCESQATIGMYTFLKARACNYTKSYFPMPYRSTMKQFSIERQAILYAIARQESRFIPASISRSFALGMMQFMPFLIKHVAKEKGENIDFDEIFNPIKALEYADFHLDYLNKYLYHPLFVAYAYNGGIGFTKKLIKRSNYFREGKFEPFLSMEKMSNIEAREYGKRVLTNYIVYLNKLGKPTRLLPYIKTLIDPSKTDKFRK